MLYISFSVRSIPLKFCFPSQTKYSPPIIVFVHGAKPYLEIFFQITKKTTFRRFRGFVVQGESAESTEIFKS